MFLLAPQSEASRGLEGGGLTFGLRWGSGVNGNLCTKGVWGLFQGEILRLFIGLNKPRDTCDVITVSLSLISLIAPTRKRDPTSRKCQQISEIVM